MHRRSSSFLSSTAGSSSSPSSSSSQAGTSSAGFPTFAALPTSQLSGPVRLEPLTASLSEQQRPPQFTYAPLLAAGSRGTEYQLLVLVHRMVELMRDNKDFEIAAEAAGYGNVDDIVIKIYETVARTRRLSRVEAYQVKYYKEAIVAEDFFNPADTTSNQDEKMQIGKSK